MMTETNPDNVVSVSKHQIPGPEKVQAVQPAKSLQTLPENGKPLPPTNEDTILQAKKLDEAVRDLNESVQSMQRELLFSIDKESGHVVIKVIDTQSQELIRQIPSEEALRFARLLNEGAELELFNTYT